MNDDKIRIAIAEACGWKWEFENPGWRWCRNGVFASLPDYLNDLNAIHEAEKTLMTDGLWYKYCDELYDRFKGEGDCHTFMHATARQRAEAFLRTKGLWK